MQIHERLTVPCLGIVILLAGFTVGVPLVYKLLLGLLGLAAAGTHFAPPAVQVETRIAIAAIGPFILIPITSTAFWLTLLSFGAMAAFQIPYRNTLQQLQATIAWLNGVLQRSSRPQAGGEKAGAANAAGGGKSAQALAQGEVGPLPSLFVRIDVAGVGSSVLCALIVVSIFLPWTILLVTFADEIETFSHTLIGAAETLEDGNAPLTFFILLLVLGTLSIASVVPPRAVAAIVAIAGLLVTVISYFYLFCEQVFEIEHFGSMPLPGVGAATLPHFGVSMAALFFLAMLMLQLIPGLNRHPGAEAVSSPC